MTTSDASGVHCEQSRANSCLAACIVMIRRRTGELREDDGTHEASLMQRLGASARGLAPESAAAELGSRLIGADPDDPGNLAVIKHDVDPLRWWHIVMLSPGPLLDLQRRRVPCPRSRHGELIAPLPHHAVVFVGVRAEGFIYLDPWFSRASQPWVLPFAEFIRAWTGRYIPARLP